ncbi:PREDICTED: uncharacterized protein LOC105974181 [Erythranthe guttata]|nr:PREDICTED: uncharacterized protein LOC105974181 [Erythranthe guttata]|eukprot:XP_012854703.1 PREDICTED: uncharacterized protein LOC105974181 [Erythranthe guttata]
MMNVLALGLVLTSLVTAGFFTPSPENQKLKDDVIVKEGHRVIVVEYEKDDGNTKVSISPQDSQAPHKVGEKGFASNVLDKMSERMENAKEGIKEASSSIIPEVGEADRNQNQEEENHHRFNARELVCDAYGKCKHKIVSALGKTKEAVAETAHEAADKVYEVEEEAKEAVGMKEGAKEMASEKAKDAEEWVEKASDKAKQSAHSVKKEGERELSEIIHKAQEVAVDAFDYAFSPDRLSPVTGILHLMGFAAAYGMCVWVTFASSYVLAGALPRNQFANVQSKIYPVYFKAMAYSVGLALFGHLMSHTKRLSPTSVGMFQGFNLMTSLAMILVNLLYLEPRATKVMLERMKKEKEEGTVKEGQASGLPSGRVVDSTAETVGRVSSTEKSEEAVAKSQIIRLSQMLQRLNSYSSLLNVFTLMSLTWHLVHLGQRLHIVS